MKRSLAIACAAMIAACGQKNAPNATQAAVPEPQEAEFRETAVADAFGAPGEEAAALAFWSHPAVPFESRIISAGPQGIAVFRIEDGAETARLPGLAARDLALAYVGVGAEATGIVAVAADGGFQFYAVEDEGGLRALPSVAVAREADGVCLGGSDRPDTATLHRANADGLSSAALSITPVAVAVASERAAAVDGGLIDCAVDERDGSVIGLAADGTLWRISAADGRAAKLGDTGVVDADDIGLLLREEGSLIAILDGANAGIFLFDLEDGHAAGAIRLKSNFDIPGPENAKAMAVGYGNYGGLYRDGAIAIASTGDIGAPIRTAPWNGIAIALELSPSASLDPRAPKRQAIVEDDPLALDVAAP